MGTYILWYYILLQSRYRNQQNAFEEKHFICDIFSSIYIMMRFFLFSSWIVSWIVIYCNYNKLILEKYQQYLTSVRKASDNTRSSYLSDIRQLDAYLSSESDAVLTAVTEDHLLMFLDFLREEGKSPSTLARNIASWKNFYSFLVADSFI